MGATRTHIDLPEDSIPALIRQLALQRGVHLGYTVEGDCLTIDTDIDTIRVCGVPQPQSKRILLRRLKKGWIYLGL